MQMYLRLLTNLARNLPKCLLIVFLMGIALPLSAKVAGKAVVNDLQQAPRINVTGIVVDESGDPVIGATILQEELAIGTTTGADGRFSLSVPEGSQLTVRSIEHEPVTVTATTSAMRIELRGDSKLIEELVVVAYGQQKKETLTGSVASVQTKELKQSAAANLSAALAGRLPGLATIQSSGQPGKDDFELYLRGKGTTNDATPLILIDGVPREGFASLDPNEIESVSILKDASATAVFGVRGANGVMLVTTRRGRAGTQELNINTNFGWQSYLAEPDNLNAWDYARFRNQALINSGSEPEYTSWMIERFRSGEDPVFFPNRNSYKDAMKRWAPQTRINVNMSGGTEKLNYFLNVGYLNTQGNFKTESKSKLGYDPSFFNNRYTFRANLDYQMTKDIKAFINLGSYIDQRNMPDTREHSSEEHMVNDILQLIWRSRPGAPLLTTEGYGVPGDQVLRSDGVWYARLNRNGYSKITSTQLQSTVGIDVNLGFITEGLSTSFMASFDGNGSSTLRGQRGYNEYDYIQAKAAWQEDRASTKSRFIPYTINRDDALSISKSFGSNYYLNLQYKINYARSFGKHDVTGMVLVQRDNWQSSMTAAELPYNLLGVAGRVTYAYDNRYMGEFNIGYNGSEQFVKGKRFGVFPAFSAGWNVHNENFLKDNRVITTLKLRGSYGITGNDKISSDRFLYLTSLSYGGGGLFSSIGRGNRVNQGRLGNPDLTWEKKKSQNYGIDLQFFRELSITADIFYEKRDDVLITRGLVPNIVGIPLGNLAKLNMGKINNRGYEIEVGYNKAITSDLRINVRGNFSYNKNKQIYMDEAMSPEDYAYRYRSTGFSIGQQFGYIRDMSNGNGYINTEEELAWAMQAYEIGTPKMGDFLYKDLNGDGVINDRDVAPVLYTDVPRINYGFSLSVNYKGFDLSAQFQGIAQVSRYYENQGIMETTEEGWYTGYHLTAWTPERYANGQKITYPALSQNKGVNHIRNDFFIMDRTFLRLKSIEIGYTLPENLLKSIGIKNLRVYANGNNLITWTKFPVNTIDPEQKAAMSFPLAKIISFGLNVTF